MKAGILAVAAGTRDDAGRSTLDSLTTRARQRFPDMELRWSYTAAAIRKRLVDTDHSVPPPAEALTRMTADGFTRVAVWALHVIPGREFHELAAAASAVTAATVQVSRPLLSSYNDLEQTAAAVLADLPPERTVRDAVILAGHGNARHPAGLIYAAAAHVFSRLDPLVFVATVGGRPSLDDILPACRAADAARAYLMPLTTLAGSTFRGVVTESDKRSWLPKLAAAGIQPVPIFRGLADYGGIADLWLAHLAAAIEELAR